MLQLACRDNAQRDAWLDAIKVLLFQHFDPVPAKDDRPATPLLTPAAPMLSPVAPLLSKVSAPGTGGYMPQLLAMLEHPLSPAVPTPAAPIVRGEAAALAAGPTAVATVVQGGVCLASQMGTHAVATAHHGGEGRGAHSSKRSDEGASQASLRSLATGGSVSRAYEGTPRLQSAPLPIISEVAAAAPAAPAPAPVLAERGGTAATRGTAVAGTAAVAAVAGAATGAPGVAGGAAAVGERTRQHARLQVDLNVLGPYEVELKLAVLAA